MINLTGILACDPGWRGLAFTLYVPSLEYTSTTLFKLNYTNNKAYKRPVHTIPLLVDQIKKDYWKSEPRLRFVDKIIIESQHKVNMQQLSWLIHSVLLTLMPWAKVEYISPLKCKRLFGVELGENWKQNKDRMLEFVINNKDKLIAGNTVTTHDSADSIILLNTFLKEKKRRVCTEVFHSVMSNVKLVCPKCGENTGSIKECRKAPNEGKHFLTCANYNERNKCGFKWLDFETPVPVVDEEGTEYMDEDMEWRVAEAGFGPPAGVKRRAAAPPKRQPPAKKPAPKTQNVSDVNPMKLMLEIKSDQDKFLAAMKSMLAGLSDIISRDTTQEIEEISE